MDEYASAPVPLAERTRGPMPTCEGYRRADGRVCMRNEVWNLNTVGCVNFVAEGIAKSAASRLPAAVDEIHAWGHPFGCSQLGHDLAHTQAVLAGLMRNPNAGGVLVLGLGCENDQAEALLARAGPVARDRLRFFNSQDVLDERASGVEAVGAMLSRMAHDRRETVPASELVRSHHAGGEVARCHPERGVRDGRACPPLWRAGAGVRAVAPRGSRQRRRVVHRDGGSGATMVLFTTGRGTPLGFPVPTAAGTRTTKCRATARSPSGRTE